MNRNSLETVQWMPRFRGRAIIIMAKKKKKKKKPDERRLRRVAASQSDSGGREARFKPKLDAETARRPEVSN